MPGSSVIWAIVGVLAALALLVWLFHNLGDGDAAAAFFGN